MMNGFWFRLGKLQYIFSLRRLVRKLIWNGNGATLLLRKLLRNGRKWSNIIKEKKYLSHLKTDTNNYL